MGTKSWGLMGGGRGGGLVGWLDPKGEGGRGAVLASCAVQHHVRFYVDVQGLQVVICVHD